MASHYEAPIRRPLVTGDKTYHDVTVDVAAPVEGKANKSWWIVFTIALTAFLWGLGVSFTPFPLELGCGDWTRRLTGHGTSPISFGGSVLDTQERWFQQFFFCSVKSGVWPSTVRQAMTIFSVIQAGLFPIIHMGRPWLAYWVLPIPNQFGSLWVNFNSPLLWDVFAISTYLSVSLVFWWTGLLPDFAMIRDRAITPFTKRVYSILSFGWSGRAKDWQRFEEVSLVLAGLATSGSLGTHHCIFWHATSVIPVYTTIFPPYFSRCDFLRVCYGKYPTHYNA